jgi:hypothetical protein
LGFRERRLRNQTPGPLPFSSMKSLPTVSMARRKATPRMASMNPLCAFLRNLNGKTLSPLKGSLKAVGMMESTGRWMPFPNKTAAWRLDLCPTAR